MSGLKASLEQHWMAIAFAEAGEWETARGLMDPTPPDPRKPTGEPSAAPRRQGERLKPVGVSR
ncbi:MAG: hypothetical protein HQL98_06465 [Magnetococcales bacterium]|nr:hypothetical protein [Magnetococcales bacterium]